MRAFAEADGAATVTFPAEGFRNVNTPADLAAAEALMYRAGQGGKRMTETIRVRVTGRVQGVAYRAWTQGEARRLGLCGWVRNEPDGTVAALLAGPPEAVAEMLATMRVGPRAAEVAEVTTEAATEHPPSGFEIRG